MKEGDMQSVFGILWNQQLYCRLREAFHWNLSSATWFRSTFSNIV